MPADMAIRPPAPNMIPNTNDNRIDISILIVLFFLAAFLHTGNFAANDISMIVDAKASIIARVNIISPFIMV
jgi:hypothetical protein